jgi:nucleoside-diphosphate-sugar epimerase
MISSVLITGGTGFLGHWLEATKPEGVTTMLLDRTTYQTRWEIGDWKAIIHLAPIAPTRVLKYAQKHNARVLYVSSGAIYDRKDDYSYHKRLWETECKHSGADVVIARPFCLVGEHLQLDRYSIGQFIQDGINGGPVHYYDIGCIRSYLYGEDAGRWLWAMLLDGFGAYDVGSSNPVSMKQVAEKVARACKCKAVCDLTPEVGKPPIYLPFTQRARVEMGLQETVSLDEAIKRTVAWNKERIKA